MSLSYTLTVPARDKAIHLWEQTSPLCFDREETLCLMHGTVISTPELYLMAMPCHSTDTDDNILTHAHTRRPRQLPLPDTLHIVHAYGNLRLFSTYFHASPWFLPIRWLAFQRRGWTLKRYPIDRIL